MFCPPRSLFSQATSTGVFKRLMQLTRMVCLRPCLVVGRALIFVLLANEGMSRAKKARIEATDSMVTETQSGYRYTQRGLSTTSRNAELMTGQILSEVSAGRALPTMSVMLTEISRLLGCLVRLTVITKQPAHISPRFTKRHRPSQTRAPGRTCRRGRRHAGGRGSSQTNGR